MLLNAVDHRWSNPERGAAPVPHPLHQPPEHVRVSPLAFTSGDQLLAKRLLRDAWSLVTPGDVDRDTLPYFNGRFVRELKNRRLELALGYEQVDYTLFEKEPSSMRGVGGGPGATRVHDESRTSSARLPASA